MSIAGGLNLSVERALSVGCTTMQIFTKSNRSWFDKPLIEEQIVLFKETVNKAKLHAIMAHAAYLINIGSRDEKTAEMSVKSLLHELGRCQQLAIPYLVLHPGSHTGAGEPTCIKKIANNLDRVLTQADGSTIILLETMAGQGSNVGYTFEQLAQIIALTNHKKLLGVCFDTCHVHAAGYNLSVQENYHQIFEQFDAIIGINNLKAFHLNDSKEPYNERKDRHAPLGQGTISLNFFKLLMNDTRFTMIPKILETPTDIAMDLYRQELILLKNMITHK
jgi:deoxyribonuclease-4